MLLSWRLLVPQIFAAATISTGIVSGDVSGILGAAWQTIASTGAKPLLQRLAESGTLTENVFAMSMTRWLVCYPFVRRTS
jgi:cathepsin D